MAEVEKGCRYRRIEPIRELVWRLTWICRGSCIGTETPFFGTTMIAQEVRCDAVEPRSRVVARQVVGTSTTKGHHEGLGREILSQLPADPAAQEPEDRSEVAIEDGRECARVEQR